MVFLIVMLTVCLLLFWGARAYRNTDVVYLYTYIPKNRHNTLCAVQKKKTLLKMLQDGVANQAVAHYASVLAFVTSQD